MELKFFLCTFLLVGFIALCSANIGDMDDYWTKRLEAANAASRASYNPKVEDVVERTSQEHVQKSMLKHHHNINSTRRSLRGKYRGECLATNPIDRCWRCQKNWAKDRKHYANCVKGFGHSTIGGLHGDIYVVTDPRDDELVNVRYGTLRWGVIQDRPLWITFAYDMNIKLKQELMINNFKTIDGRGVRVHISGGAGLTIQGVHNVIITNIYIHDILNKSGGMIRDSEHHFGFRTKSDGDCISIFTASNIWIDHVSFRHCADGIIDIVENSTAITVSNNHMTSHDHVMLLGARDENYGDRIMQTTIAFNHFGKGLTQRMPRVRYGFVHVLNNDYTHWLMYAIGGSQNPTLLVQGNRFIAPNLPYSKEVTKREAPKEVWKNWNWQEQDNVYMNGAFFQKSGKQIVHNFGKEGVIKHKPGNYVRRLTRFAGPLPCRVGWPC